MARSTREFTAHSVNLNQMLAYIADLELEVDRLRKQSEFVQEEVRDAVRRIRQLCTNPAKAEGASPLKEIDSEVLELAEVLRDLKHAPDYHPAHDQVVAIAIRPLIEQVFRAQGRLTGVSGVELRLNLQIDHVEWFPGRLRHILENLISNSLKYRDSDKTERWVQVALSAAPEEYQIRISDNGLGLSRDKLAQLFELASRSALVRDAGFGVGLAVVKMLVEQSAGSLNVDSGSGQGTTFLVVLPRYDIDDYLV